MEIKILGTNCPSCRTLEKLTRNAVIEAGINADISKVEDIKEIMAYGVISTPVLVIDGRIVIKGRVPTIKELKRILSQ